MISGESIERLFLWGHSASTVDNVDNKKVLIFGGFGGIGRHARRDDLLLLDIESGRMEVIDVLNAPCPRVGHTSSMIGDSMYVIGGRADPLNILNDVWVFNVTKKDWRLLECSNSPFLPRCCLCLLFFNGYCVKCFCSLYSYILVSSLAEILPFRDLYSFFCVRISYI